jgi:hypothetical protein
MPTGYLNVKMLDQSGLVKMANHAANTDFVAVVGHQMFDGFRSWVKRSEKEVDKRSGAAIPVLELAVKTTTIGLASAILQVDGSRCCTVPISTRSIGQL